ncbi:SAG family member [Eimeria mitis]|uniref:SAG family member n=1 Tax=Eimeria mitis TaxID=44415 RepID=U6JT10_9EIME|nr:SAG family member [Eimeria mitis]CDJ28554.1 SAG family member [Eimeria mitis]
MPVLKFLSVAAAAIFFSDINSAYGADISPGGTIETPENQGSSNDNENESGSGSGGAEDDTATNKAVRAECWEQMNAARNRVGFAELTHEKRFKITQDDWPRSVSTLEDYLSTVCKGIKTNTAPEGLTPVAGTVAYAVQEGEQADCQAAVDYWKEALTNFNGEVPPPYEANAAPYDNTQNVSFISLFNPQANPTVDCAYFVCPAAKQKAKEKDGNTETDKSMNALICVTSPSALTNSQEPFT